jgi:hypothetical protein
MRNRLCLWTYGLPLLLAASSPAWGATPSEPGPNVHDAQALAVKIDGLIAKKWAEAKAQPAPRADDAEFMRRAYLDLAGRVPNVAESRAFLDDARTDKRANLVEHLLGSPRYVTHFTNVWRSLLIPEAGNNFQVKLQQQNFEDWLRKQVARNAGYDALVRDLLTAKVGQDGGGFNVAGLVGGPGPLPYYLAKEYKPENLAASTARVFLGISVECAQCHNHPFAEWKREQFWSFAAFYSGIESNRVMDFLVPGAEDQARHEIAIPGTTQKVSARFLDGADPKWEEKKNTRATLADWVTSPTNPYFARAAVNRAWAYFFGTGLVEPVDEMVGASSNASHPELLDLLAREFAGHQFDLKFLFRALMGTQVYQLTSAAPSKSQEERSLFARMPLRGLSAEQLFDSIAAATGYRDSAGGDDLLSGLLGGNRSARSEFLTKFARSERAVEAQTSILQALTLMNGKVVADATSLNRSETLGAILDAPFLSTAERVETLYLATLSRKPIAKESKREAKFIDDAQANAASLDEAAKQTAYNDALADVFWALLNSPEFMLNH